MLETLLKYMKTVSVFIYCQICHSSPHSSDVVEMFIKPEVNCTEKLMTSILDETAHHHIQIIRPPTLPAAAFLMFCAGKFQPGTSYAVWRALKLHKGNRRLLQDETSNYKL